MSIRAAPSAAAIAPAPLHGPSRLAQVLEAGTGFASRQVSDLQEKLNAANQKIRELEREVARLKEPVKKTDPNAPWSKEANAGMAKWNQKSPNPPGVPDHYIEDRHGLFYDPTLPENKNRF